MFQQNGSIRTHPDEVRETIATLEQEASRAGRSPEAALHLYEVGRLWEKQLGNEREAALAYRRSLRIDPSCLPSLKAMRLLFCREGGWHLALPLLDREVEAAASAGERAGLFTIKGRALLQLFREDEAIGAFESALLEVPGHPPALSELEEIARGKRGAPWLSELGKRLGESLSGEDASRLLLAVSAAMERLAAPGLALELLREAHMARTGDPILRMAYLDLLEARGDPETLLHELREEAKARPSNGLALRISRLCLKLGDEAGALDALRKAPDQRDPLLADHLGRLLERQRDWGPLAKVREFQARSSTDPAQRISLFLDLAKIFEERLEAPREAIACYCEILQIDDRHGPALAALGKLQHQVGDWEGLLDTIEKEARAAKSEKERLNHLFKAAVLLEERLGDKERAISTYEQLLSIEPAHTAALRSLGRLYAQRGRWEALIRMHRKETEVVTTNDAAAALHFKVGELLEQKVCDEERAVEAYRKVLLLVPDHFPALRRLASIFRNQNAWTELVKVLEGEARFRTEPICKALLLFEAAEILEDEIGDLSAAARRYRAVLQLDRNSLPALKSMDRVLSKMGRHKERESVLERIASLSSPGERDDLLAYIEWMRLRRKGPDLLDPKDGVAWEELEE